MSEEQRIYDRATVTGRWRSCYGKTRFPSRKNARARAKAIGGWMNAYRCSVCRHWHVGHDRYADLG